MYALGTRSSTAGVRRRVAALAAVALVGGVACTGEGGDATPPSTTARVTTTTTPARSSDGTLVLGIYLPTTGAGSDLGQPMIAAVENAIERINNAGGVLGRDVLHQSADEGAGTGLGELLNDGVDAIVGPASSLNALAQLGPAVDPTSGVVVCSPSATALALDDYPDNTFLFRTAPSDSLQMAFIARQAQRTGARSVAVGYLDDLYGRGLFEAFETEIEQRRIPVVASRGFSGDEEDLSDIAAELLEQNPGVVVVLGDADDGGRLLAALDEAGIQAQQVIVNDAIRNARATIQTLSSSMRARLLGVAPLARAVASDAPPGFFAAHAVDCVNLIALAALVAGSDDPKTFRTNMASVSSGGRVCGSFDACATLLERGLDIDYNGASGSAELSNATGDPVQARFEQFRFDSDGLETDTQWFDIP
ncbi:MAG: ABC transporter substrate-binding protein [Ilumatobacter sp.]|nr:ABC transporter substrate-binding protein [Ilumatobacter sp.]